MLGGVIARGIERGEFRALRPSTWRACHGAAPPRHALAHDLRAVRDQTPYDYTGLIEAHIETLLKGLAP